jgi:hypothetical protein
MERSLAGPASPPRASLSGVSAVRASALVFAVVVLYAVFCWFLFVAPPLVSFALAGAAAVAWCIWLEKHSEEVSVSTVEEEITPQ